MLQGPFPGWKIGSNLGYTPGSPLQDRLLLQSILLSIYLDCRASRLPVPSYMAPREQWADFHYFEKPTAKLSPATAATSYPRQRAKGRSSLPATAQPSVEKPDRKVWPKPWGYAAVAFRFIRGGTGQQKSKVRQIFLRLLCSLDALLTTVPTRHQIGGSKMNSWTISPTPLPRKLKARHGPFRFSLLLVEPPLPRLATTVQE